MNLTTEIPTSFFIDKELIEWLMQGDVAIQFQAKRDLLDRLDLDLQKRIATEGWGENFLSKRRVQGHWGKRFYEPKWISSHYTLLDLKNLGIHPDHPLIRSSMELIFESEKGPDGGMGPIGDVKRSDICVNGMFLNYASYFSSPKEDLYSVVDFLLENQMPDGGFNCRSNRGKAIHSSMHSTISVVEGITEYHRNKYTYRLDELLTVRSQSIEFLLCHQLFKSDRTGEIIHPDFLKFPYPFRWKYNVLRAMDAIRLAEIPWDDRMAPAIDVILNKRKKNGSWNVQAKHPGQLHFEMEKAGKPSRWITLIALRILRQYHDHLTPSQIH